jgi:transmembrane sensor
MTTGKDYKDFSEQGFISDPYFQNWLISPDEEKNNFWQGFLADYPEKKEAVEKARSLLQSIAFKESWPAEEQVERSLTNALKSINQADKTAPVPEKRAIVRPLYKTWWAAAAVLVFVVFGLWFLVGRDKVEQPSVAATPKVQDIAPGGDKAVLVLADGRKVVLDTAGNGAITKQGGVTVIKLNDGQLSYQPSTSTSTSTSTYNTITTPKGGQYQLVLADGTKVWLNAASSLRFPTAFTAKDRRVELTGEGYFEVAHNQEKPFIVQRGEAEVKVLGTHFNINGYADEPSLKVTLLEGRVMVRKNEKLVYLNPGQQAEVQPAQQSIKVDYEVDTEEVVAWKNGLFIFNNTPLEAIMKQLERWYDVDVIYQGKVPRDRFNGNISRNNNLSEVLKVLEYSDIRFKVEGKNIIVLP